MGRKILGIDIGGSGIKCAPIDVETGQLLAERIRILTPQPATPSAIAQSVTEVVRHFNWTGDIGCAFPAVIQHGVSLSAANIDKSWIGAHVEQLLENATGCRVAVINDADAAALGEVTFGAGRGQKGLILMLTFGTGIGSGVVLDGRLVPNTELGHLELGGKEVESWASDRIRERDDLSWEKWAKRVQKYLDHLEMLFTPDMLIIGGGTSRKASKFRHLLKTKAELVIAELRNEAGIVGAALAAHARWPSAPETAEVTRKKRTPKTAKSTEPLEANPSGLLIDLEADGLEKDPS